MPILKLNLHWCTCKDREKGVASAVETNSFKEFSKVEICLLIRQIGWTLINDTYWFQFGSTVRILQFC